MRFGDPILLNWLNKEVKLFPAIVDLEKQFQNWFYFQDVLYKTGNSLPEILINKFDDLTSARNMKIVKKHIVKLTGTQPKIAKGQSIIEEYLRVIKQYAQPIKASTFVSTVKEQQQVLEELVKTLKITDRRQVQSLENNHEEKFINSMQPKQIRIEKSLQQFRDEKIRHEIQAVKMKQEDEEREKQWLQMLRQVEIEKIRANHEFIKEQDKKIYAFWQSTENVKHERLKKEAELNVMMTQRLKDGIAEARNQDKREMHENLNQFIQTCIRQGVELKKDPSKKREPEKAKFSAVATMMKIKDRSRKNEEARKARSKRRNKMMVEQVRQQEEIEAKKRLDDLLDKYNEYNGVANQNAARRLKDRVRGEMQFEERFVKCEMAEIQMQQYFDELRRIAKAREKDVELQRLQEYRAQQLQYMQINYDRKLLKRNKHNIIMQPLILSLLDLTDKCYLFMQEQGTITLDNKFWKVAAANWMQELCQPKTVQEHTVAEKTPEFFNYYCGGGDWRQTDNVQPIVNEELGNFLFHIVDLLYPMAPMNEGINYELPLKISLIGGKFSGRKTTAKYLSTKYNLEIIDIEQIMKEAIKLANPPPDDPKKKKDPKKVEQPVIENPELKAFGLELAEYKEGIPDQILLKGVLIKLSQTFGQRTPTQIAEEMIQAEQQSQAPVAVVEEPKKSSKKPGKKEVAPVQTGPTQEELIKEYMNAKSFYYTKGWVMIGFPATATQAKLLEEALSGYIPIADRLNAEAEEKKRVIGELVSPAPVEESTQLLTSGTDLIVYLEASIEQRVSRMQNRRLDPATEIVYNLEEFPPPVEIKADKLLKLEDENEEKLQRDLIEHQENREQLKEWCDAFGFGDSFKQLHAIKPEGKGYEVAKSLDTLIDYVIDIKKDHFIEIQQEYLKRLQSAQALDQQVEQVEEPADVVQIAQEPGQKSQRSVREQLRSQGTGREAQKSQQTARQSMKSQQTQQSQPESVYEKTAEELHGILLQWDETSNSYIKESSIYIKRMNQQRKKCGQQFLQCQRLFLEQFEKPDNKLELMHIYQQNYNRFIAENEDLSKQKNAKAQLNQHLQVVYEQLWDILDGKRKQAMQFLEKLKQDRFVLVQIQQYMQHVFMLLQMEINLLSEICQLGKPWNEHLILEPPSTDLVSEYQFPQLDLLINYYYECLDKVVVDENPVTKTQKDIAIYRGSVIRNLAVSKMKEMLLMEDMLYQRIDDWIILGIKRQNDYCYECFQSFKQCIEERVLSVLQVPEPDPISDDFHLIYMSMHRLPLDDTFNITLVMFEELKSLADSNMQIPVTVFEQYLKRRSSVFQQYNITTKLVVQYFGVQDNKIYYPSLSLVMILWNMRIPNGEEWKQYLVDLKQVDSQDVDEFCEVQAWFDTDNAEMEYDLSYFLKRFIYNLIASSDNVGNLNNIMKYIQQINSGVYFSDLFREEQ